MDNTTPTIEAGQRWYAKVPTSQHASIRIVEPSLTTERWVVAHEPVPAIELDNMEATRILNEYRLEPPETDDDD